MTPNLIDKTRPLFDTLGRAMKVYENIRLNDPTGPLADDAIMATANSYFRRGRYNDADYQYDLLRKEYPRSDHQFNAHVLGLQCKLRKYQGPDYDGTPLEEAKQLVKQQKIQFAGELDDDQRQRLAEIDGQVNRELATREYGMAEHFDDLEEYGSAKFYYAQVVEELSRPRRWPSRPASGIAALGGVPDRPESKLGVAGRPGAGKRRASRRRRRCRWSRPRDETPLLGRASRDDAAPTQGDAASGPTIRR